MEIYIGENDDYKIAVCEDEKSHQGLLIKNLCMLFSELCVDYEIYIFDSGEQLLSNYPEDVDIFLLDIQMYGLSGMDIARKIREVNKNKVFLNNICTIKLFLK